MNFTVLERPAYAHGRYDDEPVANPHERIVTPDTDPDRWTDLEAALFRAGLCGWQVSDGG